MKKSNTFITSFVTASLLLAGSAYAQSRGASHLPPPGEEVSLQKFDSYMNELEVEIQDRLGQLSPGTGSKDENGLDRPDTEPYASDLEILSKVQRDTKVLEAMLKKATLAKQVWSEVHSNPREQYESRIRALEAQVNEQRNKAMMLEEDFQRRVQTLQAERDDALNRHAAAEARIRNMEMQSSSRGSSTSPGGIQQPRPRIVSIVNNGPQSHAVFSLPDGRRTEASPGDVFFFDYVVQSIDRDSVVVHRNGSPVYLSKGSYPRVGDGRDMQNGMTQDTAILDQVSSYANN